MYHSHAIQLFAFCLVEGVALVCFFATLGPAESPKKTTQ